MMLNFDEASKEKMRAEVPLGRMAGVTDVAAAVLFLASPAASFITGSVLPVDGGLAGCMR